MAIGGELGAQVAVAEVAGAGDDGVNNSTAADELTYSTVFVYVSDPDDANKSSTEQGTWKDDEVKTVYVPLTPPEEAEPALPAKATAGEDVDRAEKEPSTAAGFHRQGNETGRDSVPSSHGAEQAQVIEPEKSSPPEAENSSSALPRAQRESVAAGQPAVGGASQADQPPSSSDRPPSKLPLQAEKDGGVRRVPREKRKAQHSGTTTESKVDSPTGNSAEHRPPQPPTIDLCHCLCPFVLSHLFPWDSCFCVPWY